MAVQFQPSVSFFLLLKVRVRVEQAAFTEPTPIGGGCCFSLFQSGLTAAQPIGSGTNSFDADRFSRVPIYSAGINWDLNRARSG